MIQTYNDVYRDVLALYETKSRLKKDFSVYQVNFVNPLECQEAQDLGMESGTILDSEISASSQYDSNHFARQGRLNFRGGWRAAVDDENQWLQIDLGKGFANVTRVGTQGRWGAN